MKTGTILLSGITGTTIMTFFSYLVSEKKSRNFREPLLLSKIFERGIPPLNVKEGKVAGWTFHYLVGIIFSFLYEASWKHSGIKPGLSEGACIGAVSGIVAIIAWDAVLRLHPDPPEVSKGRYYPHLFLAHVIFGAFAVAGRELARRDGFNEHPEKKTYL